MCVGTHYLHCAPHLHRLPHTSPPKWLALTVARGGAGQEQPAIQLTSYSQWQGQDLSWMFASPAAVSFLGDAKSSLGDVKSSLGDAESSLGDAESSLGDAESSLGDAESSLGDAKSSLGDTKSSLGEDYQVAAAVNAAAVAAAQPNAAIAG
jgi:hypothetical protein